MTNEDVDPDTLEELALVLFRERRQLLEQLVSIRKQKQLTQAVVAERMGVSQPAVSDFEHYDANPTLNSLVRYALAVHAELRLGAHPSSLTEDHALASSATRVPETK